MVFRDFAVYSKKVLQTNLSNTFDSTGKIMTQAGTIKTPE